MDWRAVAALSDQCLLSPLSRLLFFSLAGLFCSPITCLQQALLSKSRGLPGCLGCRTWNADSQEEEDDGRCQCQPGLICGRPIHGSLAQCTNVTTSVPQEVVGRVKCDIGSQNLQPVFAGISFVFLYTTREMGHVPGLDVLFFIPEKRLRD